MSTFRTQHPETLISRLFMLEYMNKISKDVLHSKANEYQKSKFFYRYEDEKGNISLDMNWEHLLFIASIAELENFLKNFLEELLVVDKETKELITKMELEKRADAIREPASINLRDYAQADVKNKSNKIILN